MLIGRDRELGRIEELLARVRSGGGAVGLLEGPAGIGKTALLSEASVRAARMGWCVLRASGAEFEREYAFGVVRQLFSSVMASGRGSELLEGAAGLAAVPLGLRDTSSGGVEASVDTASGAMHGLFWLTANLADRAPVLVAVDDAHWADEMSLQFVLYLARRVEDLPVVLLVAARTVAQPGHGDLLDQLRRRTGAVSLCLEPLSRPDVGRVIAEVGLPDADVRFVDACHHASGGNPFLLGELLAELRAQGLSGRSEEATRVAGLAPYEIVRWVLARLAELGEDAQKLAFAFAVLGVRATLADAALLADVDSSAAAVAADALIGAELLAGEGSYALVHPLVQGAVHDAMGRVRRARAHARGAFAG